jgi:hypothetical protein
MLRRVKQLRVPITKYRDLLEHSGNRKLRQAADEISFSTEDWVSLDEILNPLEAYLEASLALESTKKPTAHLVCRILVDLIYLDERVNNEQYTTEQMGYYICNAANNYLAECVDNTVYFKEFALAAFFDPRQKDL